VITLLGLHLGLTSGWAVGPIWLNLDPTVCSQFSNQKDLRKFMLDPFSASKRGTAIFKIQMISWLSRIKIEIESLARDPSDDPDESTLFDP
jgi:hypothetical protein